MKKILFLSIALIATGSVFAQGGDRMPRSSEAIAQRQSEKMKSALSLSESQYATVHDINLKYARTFSEMMKDSAVTREEKHNKMKQLREEKRTEIDKVLSAEQKQQWEKQKQDMKTKRGNRDHGPHKKGDHQNRRKNDHTQSLGLSEAQTTKLDAVRKEFRTEISGIREDQKLSEEQRKEKMKTAWQNHEKSVEEILSPEQYVKWKESRKNGKHKRLHQDHQFRK